MKKSALFLILFLSLSANALATNLIEVYQQALVSDPVYQQNIATELATLEGVAISRANLLPSIGLTSSPSLSKIITSGPSNIFVPNHKTRGYTVNLTATQEIFNFAQFANLAQASAIARQGNATLNAAAQDLMIRVASAYFQVLEDEDILRASLSTKTAFAKQLDQVNQQYQVGIKTITDVYTAQASYQGSVADYIATQNTLANDRENLRVITGVLYKSLAKLSEKFPLVSPKPANIETWAELAVHQNWQVRAAQFGVKAAQENIRQQFAGHLPTLNVQGTYDINFTRVFVGADNQFNEFPPGSGQMHTSAVLLNLAVPIIQGGQVLALTRQAQDNFRLACQQLEQQLRSAMNVARQSYLGVESGISKIQADKKAIQSAISSLEGMEAGYRVGTEILVNVLNQQQQVLIDQKQYAHDRYAYVRNLLTLKQAAGTLNPWDLATINAWLINDKAAIKEPTKKKS